MNYWTQLSIEYANQRNYLDELFSVYSTIPEGIRDIDTEKWKIIEDCFNKQDNEQLVKAMLTLDLFPIKDSYVAYLKHDKSAIVRNPKTVNRLAGRMYELGLSKLYEKCTEPKETNRQIGPLFKNWINKGSLGMKILSLNDFENTQEDAILNASDSEMMNWAQRTINYTRNKGLDFVARIKNKYVIGEAKFLTDFGGHQNAQFNDAIDTLTTNVDAITVAILDGVLYIPSNNKLYKAITETYKDYNIVSILVLREFLYSL